MIATDLKVQNLDHRQELEHLDLVSVAALEIKGVIYRLFPAALLESQHINKLDVLTWIIVNSFFSLPAGCCYASTNTIAHKISKLTGRQTDHRSVERSIQKLHGFGFLLVAARPFQTSEIRIPAEYQTCRKNWNKTDAVPQDLLKRTYKKQDLRLWVKLSRMSYNKKQQIVNTNNRQMALYLDVHFMTVSEGINRLKNGGLLKVVYGKKQNDRSAISIPKKYKLVSKNERIVDVIFNPANVVMEQEDKLDS